MLPSVQTVLTRSLLTLTAMTLFCANAQGQLSEPEQRRITWHESERLSRYRRPASPAPVTVATADPQLKERFITLDEAIAIALRHSEVIRVLTGVSASSTGRTVYDTAVSTTNIDQAVARFDPVFSANSSWRKNESPFSRTDPFDPLRALVAGSQLGGNDTSIQLSQTNRLGGIGAFTVLDNWTYGGGGTGTLSPVHRPTVELSYTQPLLAGAGRAANEAPIVIARYDQDRSYFQFKDSMQNLLQSVITGYWSLVEARTQLWAREIQVQQAQEAYEFGQAQLKTGNNDIGNVAQTRTALANFRASLVITRANVIQREAALRNALGLPPEDGTRLVPSTPPTRERIQFDWQQLVETAQQRRPDLIELNLILLADQQRRVQADNLAKPTFNAVGVHSWNGLRGQMLSGATLNSGINDNPSWTMGVTFEVPLTLRSARASLRSSELLLARDRANIQQGLHATEHTLATTVRSLDQFYMQYKAFQESREAARINLELQDAQNRARRVIFLNVLQAITDWGNAVSSEATALTGYNSTLATLERETGTILDTHGIVFNEERFLSIGPWGRKYERECYPLSLRPGENTERYENGNQAAEKFFDLDDIPKRRLNQDGQALPPPSVPLSPIENRQPAPLPGFPNQPPPVPQPVLPQQPMPMPMPQPGAQPRNPLDPVPNLVPDILRPPRGTTPESVLPPQSYRRESRGQKIQLSRLLRYAKDIQPTSFTPASGGLCPVDTVGREEQRILRR